jgi:hypothetical protein
MKNTRHIARVAGLVFTLACGGWSTLSAQSQNCDLTSGAGGSLSAGSSTAFIGFLSPTITRSGESAGLDLVQYIFTNPNDPVFDDFSGRTGARILLANDNGRVDPAADLGLEQGDEFCVFSWSFSLSVLQDQVDTLYNSSFLGVSCCLFAEATQGVDVCSLMQDAGILEGADLEDFNDIASFAVAYGVQATFESISFLVDSFINVVPPGSPCTPGGRMCYATSNTLCFAVDTGSSTGFTQVMPSWAASLQAGPNPVLDRYRVSLESAAGGYLDLNLYDQLGRRVLTRRENLQPGTNQLDLDLSHLPPGPYALRLLSKDGEAGLRLLRE